MKEELLSALRQLDAVATYLEKNGFDYQAEDIRLAIGQVTHPITQTFEERLVKKRA